MAISAIKGESSLERVMRDAEIRGLEINVRQMDQSTRTAKEAADACGCDVGQIIKSLVFERVDTGELVLVLVSGKNNADLDKLKKHFGTELKRADPRHVRDQTGFAIGGVSPIGHLTDLSVLVDEDLVEYSRVWAAAGRPDAVFEVSTPNLIDALNCVIKNIKQ